MVYNFCIQEIKAYNFALIKIEKGEKEMYKEALRPVWAEINLSNLDYNIKNIKAKIGDRGKQRDANREICIFRL